MIDITRFDRMRKDIKILNIDNYKVTAVFLIIVEELELLAIEINEHSKLIAKTDMHL